MTSLQTWFTSLFRFDEIFQIFCDAIPDFFTVISAMFTFKARNLSSKIPIGDGNYKPYVCSDPDVTTVEMNGTEDFVIVACDGLWDTVSLEEASECVFNQLRKNKGESNSASDNVCVKCPQGIIMSECRSSSRGKSA